MDEAWRLITESQQAIEWEREAIRNGSEPATIPDYPGNVYVVEESDPRIVAAMIETGQWGVICRHTRGREEIAVYWCLLRV